MGAQAGKQDFTVQAGATWTEGPMTYKINGVAVDLTTWHARMQVRETIASPDPVLTATDTDASPDPRLILGGIAGTVGIQVEAVDMSPLNTTGVDKSYFYGIELFKTVGGVEQVVPLLQGSLTVKAEVVR
jgi:hypothetical protein